VSFIIALSLLVSLSPSIEASGFFHNHAKSGTADVDPQAIAASMIARQDVIRIL